MPAERLSMRKIREILRLKWGFNLSNRQVAKSCGVSRSTVSDYEIRAKAANLSWPLPENLSEDVLEKLLFAKEKIISIALRPLPDWHKIHRELKRKGVTLSLLWQEYKLIDQEGIGYSQFCDRYRKFTSQFEPSLRQAHKAGEKLFVDYAGMTLSLVNSTTGEITEVQIFVAVLGASNYTYVEATKTQTLPDWINSHIHTFHFLGGVPEIVVPDNLKSGVNNPHRYDPEINPTYQEMANHYGIAIIPARARKPKDKAKVEVGVQNVERQILARLRDRTFFNLEEMNVAIRELLDIYNARLFQKLEGSRLSQFNAIDKPTLKSLPTTGYEYAQWKKVRVAIDYHIAFEHHFYSVPYQYLHHDCDLRYTMTFIEIFYKGKSIATHARSYQHGHTTLKQHMPKSHQAYVEWTPERLLNWANKIGKATAQFIDAVMASRAHPQQGYRASLGILRLGKSFGEARLEKAAERALSIGAISYKSIESILKTGLDQQSLSSPTNTENKTTQVHHEFIRGSNYYI